MIDFYSKWSPCCQVQEPVVNQPAKQFKGQALAAVMNIDLHQKIPRKIGIFKEGKEVRRIIGCQHDETLSNALENELN